MSRNWITDYVTTPPNEFERSAAATQAKHAAFAENLAAAVLDQVYGGVVPSISKIDIPEPFSDEDQCSRLAAIDKLNRLLEESTNE